MISISVIFLNRVGDSNDLNFNGDLGYPHLSKLIKDTQFVCYVLNDGGNYCNIGLALAPEQHYRH
jgi:hypothetical protein